MAYLSNSRSHPAPVVKAVAACAPTVQLTWLQRVFGVWRQRQHLDRLPQHMRRDIGLTDADIAREVQRPIWDAPKTWRI